MAALETAIENYGAGSSPAMTRGGAVWTQSDMRVAVPEALRGAPTPPQRSR
jgi:hypothetical protein